MVGQWFKWTFSVLVEFALINTPDDGNVRAKILDYITDVEKIKQYNWCNYVISRLHDTQKSWKKNIDIYRISYLCSGKNILSPSTKNSARIPFLAVHKK